MRLIDADALIEKAHHEAQGMSKPFKDQFGVLVEWLVEKTQPIEPEPKWIPCSERLPEPNEEDSRGFIKAYLVQDARWIDVARWDGDNWIAWGYGTRLKNVIAWMPLPEPYQEENDMTNAEAIETLRANYPDACFEQLREAVDKAIKALEEPKWIPCSERLPEEDGTMRGYLVTIGGWVGILPFVGGEFVNCDLYGNRKKPDYPVIAWMPLPKRYREEGGER